MTGPESEPLIKLADFGLAREGTRCEGKAGTFLYTAPEVFDNCAYDAKIDVWSLGVVIVQLLMKGNVPNPTTGSVQGPQWCKDVVYTAMRNFDAFFNMDMYSLDTRLWGFVTGTMIHMDPKARYSAQKCLDSAWMLDDPWQIDAPAVTESPRTNLKRQPNGSPSSSTAFSKKSQLASVTKTELQPSAIFSHPSIAARNRSKHLTQKGYDTGIDIDAVRKHLQITEYKTTREEPSTPENPQPLGFGLVFEDNDNNTSKTQQPAASKKPPAEPDRAPKSRAVATLGSKSSPRSQNKGSSKHGKEDRTPSKPYHGGPSVAGPSRHPRSETKRPVSPSKPYHSGPSIAGPSRHPQALQTKRPRSPSKTYPGGPSAAGPSRPPRAPETKRPGSPSVTSHRRKSSVSASALKKSPSNRATGSTSTRTAAASNTNDQFPNVPLNLSLFHQYEAEYGADLMAYIKYEGEFPAEDRLLGDRRLE